MLAWQFHAGNLMAVSAGLGALLCLERRDRRGDLAVADLRARAGRVDVFVRRYAAQRCGG